MYTPTSTVAAPTTKDPEMLSSMRLPPAAPSSAATNSVTYDTEVDTAGDGFLARFDGPARAIRCGLAVRDALRDLDVEIRVGIHTGEVERTRSGPRGIAVHIASRILSLAEPGEVLVSQTTRDLVEGSGIALADRGEHQLKGIEGPRRVYSAG